jgi:hypothetical protein
MFSNTAAEAISVVGIVVGHIETNHKLTRKWESKKQNRKNVSCRVIVHEVGEFSFFFFFCLIRVPLFKGNIIRSKIAYRDLKWC